MNDTRNRTLARVHASAKADGLAGDAYKAKLKRRTGKESCADLTDPELAAVAAATRPTQAQRGQIWHLCREIGLDGGTEGDAFKTLVGRIFKTEDPARALRYLTRTQARNLITALVNWKRSLAKRGLLPPAGGAAPQAQPNPATR